MARTHMSLATMPSTTSAGFSLGFHADPYAQRRDWTQAPWLDRALAASSRLLRGFACGSVLPTRFELARVLRAVHQCRAQLMQTQLMQTQLRHSDTHVLQAEAQALRRALGRQGFTPALSARCLALVSLHAQRSLGLQPFDVQLQGAYVMLQARVLEMATGEGKTLTAGLAAAAAGLAGLAVHVVTVNDYLAARDAKKLSPLYAALGLRVAVVLEGDDLASRSKSYLADVVYCSNKTVVFDYLRDRQRLADRMQPLALSLDRLLATQPQGSTTLRGLHFAIVDEADSVFIDEARTPLILSALRGDEAAAAYYRQAIELARRLDPQQDITLDIQPPRVALTPSGRQQLLAWLADLPPVWQPPLRSEETVTQALSALHLYRRDEHYIVADGKVQIVDENTGRVMPDRSWEQGLHQMIEAKEGVALTAGRETLARISYQLFFRRYLRLAGMSGTVREVAGEIASVFGPGVTRVAPRLPSRRCCSGQHLLPNMAAKWQAVATSVAQCQAKGQPALVGTRSVAASEAISHVLTLAGITHTVLNAKQDADEAATIEAAGQPGRVTIATNMAGRGTDIVLADASRQAGGLHVILTERHDNARVDRQLVGRCARQGDPGSWQALLSLDDELLRSQPAAVRAALARGLATPGLQAAAQALGLALMHGAQRRTERAHAAARRNLLSSDFQTRQALSFSGQME
jgi:preprotein translocase subunit SecA